MCDGVGLIKYTESYQTNVISDKFGYAIYIYIYKLLFTKYIAYITSNVKLRNCTPAVDGLFKYFPRFCMNGKDQH